MKKKTNYHYKLSKLVNDLSEDDAKTYFEHLSKLVPVAGERTDFWSGLMGLKWLQKEQGNSRCEVEVTPVLLNPSTILAANERSATIEIKLNFLAAVYSGKVIADTTVVHPGKKIAYMETKIRSDDGRLIAIANGSYYRFGIDSK